MGSEGPPRDEPRGSRAMIPPMLQPSQIAPAKFRPLKRTEYEHLVSLGCFRGERVELLYGALVTMTPQDPEHTSPVEQLNYLLVPLALSRRAAVRVQSPFAASDDSEPEPDVAVVPFVKYGQEHPKIGWLVVEVANTSLAKDRDVKRALYAQSNVEEYWIVHVPTRTVEVHRNPLNGVYTSIETRRMGETLTVQHFPDVSFLVDAIFQ